MPCLEEMGCFSDKTHVEINFYRYSVPDGNKNGRIIGNILKMNRTAANFSIIFVFMNNAG